MLEITQYRSDFSNHYVLEAWHEGEYMGRARISWIDIVRDGEAAVANAVRTLHRIYGSGRIRLRDGVLCSGVYGAPACMCIDVSSGGRGPAI